MELIRGMDDETYHGIDAVSASRLKDFLRSPMHMHHHKSEPKSSPALAFGSAFHCAVLESLAFERKYAVAPADIDRRTTVGKAAWESFLAASAGKRVISADDWDVITGMAREILLHPSAGELVAGRTETEASLFWSRDGIACKARLDAYNADWKAIIDIKSTENSGPSSFARSIASFGYHVQAAWYIDAARAAGLDVECMVFVAVEKKRPHAVGVYRLDDESVDAGRLAIEASFPRIVDCMRTNTWPGYADEVLTIGLPRWALDRSISEEVQL